ncbi:MAG: ribonuclease J [Ruminococcaceae bacterium]|nr:ribonuclease J [Oscillospiraceae bacterium]
MAEKTTKSRKKSAAAETAAAETTEKLTEKAPKAAKPAKAKATKSRAAKADGAAKTEKAPRAAKNEKLKIIPLGGLNEIGKNMTVIEYGNDIIVVDCGVAFPDEEMLGIDLVIPDTTYLENNLQKVRGIFLTHGHEDHIGALPYVLKKINVPVYGTTLTLGLVETKLAEHKMLSTVKLNRVALGDTVRIGSFIVEFIRTNHSLADSAALAINTPMGAIIFTSDFKIDPTPVAGEMIDLTRFGEYGNNGVLLLMQDSTNVERPGYSLSESKVGETLDGIVKHSDKRVIIATFASNVHRVQQILNIAAKYKRKVAVSGRSMENIIAVGSRLGYLTVPENTLVELSELGKFPKHKTLIISTGSQGEPMSALYRMAFSSHRQIEVGADDLIVVSASPIPGNESSVYRMINELFKKGAEVIYDRMSNIHASGHACQEELKMILALTRPQYFMPVHGEHRHLIMHKDLAAAMGVHPRHIFVSEIGKVLEITQKGARLNGTVPSGKVLIDGLSVGDVGSVVLRDRQLLSQDGLIAVILTLDGTSGQMLVPPEVVTRGFVYVKESEELMNEMKAAARGAMERCEMENVQDWTTIKSIVKKEVSNLIYQKTKRSPMILPIITEV